jgi:hypothetical protein
MRDQAQPQPIEIRVVNAEKIGTGAKVATVKRDDEGKISRLVMAGVPDPS